MINGGDSSFERMNKISAETCRSKTANTNYTAEADKPFIFIVYALVINKSVNKKVSFACTRVPVIAQSKKFIICFLTGIRWILQEFGLLIRRFRAVKLFERLASGLNCIDKVRQRQFTSPAV